MNQDMNLNRTPSQIRKAIRTLGKTVNLLTPRERWTKNHFAKNAKGRGVVADTVKELKANAVCFCTAGAISVVQGENPEHLHYFDDPAFAYAGFVMDGDVTKANDRRSTTHMQVLNALDFARLLAKDDLKRLK